MHRYDLCTPEEKKEIINALIEKIEIFEEKQEDGRIIKAVWFKFPVFVNGEESNGVFLSKETNVETVVLMSRVSK